MTIEAVVNTSARSEALETACRKAAEEIMSDSRIVPFDRLSDGLVNKIAAIIYKNVRNEREL